MQSEVISSPARLSPRAAAPASPAETQLAVRWPRRWRRASTHPCQDGAPTRRLERRHPLGQLLAWRGLTPHAAAVYAAMPRARRAVGASGLLRPPSPRAALAAARSRSPDKAGNHMMRGGNHMMRGAITSPPAQLYTPSACTQRQSVCIAWSRPSPDEAGNHMMREAISMHRLASPLTFRRSSSSSASR